MNRFMKILLSGLCLASLVGCSSKTAYKDDGVTESSTEKSLDKGTPSDNFMDAQIGFDGYILNLPCTYDQFTELTGWEIGSDDAELTLNNGQTELITIYDPNDFENEVAWIYIVNDTGETALYQDCTITSVMQSRREEVNDSQKVIFAGGLKIGEKITLNKLTKLLGEPTSLEPDSVEEFNGTNYKTVRWNSFDPGRYLKVVISDGAIEELSIHTFE